MMTFLVFLTFMTVLFSFGLPKDQRMSVVSREPSSPVRSDIHLPIFAKKLIDLINKFDKNGYFQTVIDIGSGRGDITKWLSTQIELGQLNGIEINSTDIKFAEKNEKTEKIDYVLTDLSEDWGLVTEPIRRLQSNVSLAFSNFFIMYIKEKLTLLQNIRKLMAPGARAYISFVLLPDPTFKLTNELRESFGRYSKTPPIDEQHKTWTDLFKGNGFEIEYQVNKPIPVFFKKDHHRCVHWEDISDDIRDTLIRVTADQNLTQNSVDWKTLDRIKNEGQTRDLEIIYTNVYIVCKAIE